MAFSDTFVIIILYSSAHSLSEVANWFFIFKTDSFRKLTDDLDKAEKKLQELKAQGVDRIQK